MIANGAKEQLMKAFDRTQTAFESWDEAKTELKRVQDREREAATRYLNAKIDWEKQLKACSPGDIGVGEKK